MRGKESHVLVKTFPFHWHEFVDENLPKATIVVTFDEAFTFTPILINHVFSTTGEGEKE